MKCPYCHKQITFVTNSRPTKDSGQIWRRRSCSNCKEIFTTHEIVDLSHLIIIKKSGKHERYNKMKLYSGIYGATIGSKTPNREFIVNKLTEEVENELLFLKRKEIGSEIIGEIVLNKLKKLHTGTFLRFFAYHKNIKNENQMDKEISKYIKINSQ